MVMKMKWSLILASLFTQMVVAGIRSGRPDIIPVQKASNTTFEWNYQKAKLNFLKSHTGFAGGSHPLCQYSSFFGLAKTSYYSNFYKKKCVNSALPEYLPGFRGPSSAKVRKVRHSRRVSRKKHQINPRKRKKLDRLLKKAMCRPIKTMVPVVGPESQEEVYPCKVMVNRCSGCCLSRMEDCYPVKTKLRRFDVLRLSPFPNQSLYRAKLVEHVKCQCQCKIKKSDCGPRQIYDEDNCHCKCPSDSHRLCTHPKRWNDNSCKCVCKRQRECSSGMTFSHETCLCEQQHEYGKGFLYKDLT